MTKKFWIGNPEGKRGYTKVVGMSQGFRAKVLAVNKKDKYAVILGLNGEIRGQMWEVMQKKPTQWMELVGLTTQIPGIEDWEILF